MWHKFHAKKTEYNGVTYDSKKEAKRAEELDLLVETHEITNLQRQVPFELQPAFKNNENKAVRAITYIADFVYQQNGKTIVEDVKGVKTKEYMLKKKMFQYKYPEYTFKEYK